MTETPQTKNTSSLTSTGSVHSPRRIEFLDVLRGFAAMMVLVQHSIESSSLAFIQWTNRYVNLGEVGVVVFFIVSGFIIPVSLEKYNSLSRFWFGRILRLWPIYILSLLVMVGLNQMKPVFPSYYDHHPFQFIMGNLSMIGEYLKIPLALQTYWTLSLELVFYAVCSILWLFGLLQRSQFWLWLSALLLLSTQICVAMAMHKSLPAGRIGLVVSAFWGSLLYRHLSANLSTARLYLNLLGLFVVFTVCFWIRYGVYPPVAHVATLYSPAASAANTVASWTTAYLIFMGVFSLRASQFPKGLIWIGQLSYPLYLFHGIVLNILPRTLPGGWPTHLFTVLVLTLPIAYLVHVFVELPLARINLHGVKRRNSSLPGV